MLLVVVQFSCLGFLFFTGPGIADSLPLLLLEFIAFGIGIWGIIAMRRSRLNVFPDVLYGSSLVKEGPYKLIRHPMYTALILMSFSLVISSFSYARMAVAIVLIVNLLFKIQFEEKLLCKAIPAYADYKMKTWKIIPLIY